MKIIEKINKKMNNRGEEGAVTLAFFGDSITEGCFDIYIQADGHIGTYVDVNKAYHTVLKQELSKLYPICPVNIINAGISGANARHSLDRLDRDVIRHGVDLCVISFGSNDMWGGFEGIDDFRDAIKSAIQRLTDAGIEVIVMSAPMNCTCVSHKLTEPRFIEIAKSVAENVNSGVLKAYAKAAGEAALEMGVAFIDLYEKFELMHNAGVNVTDLLDNHINHPNGDMHRMMAMLILERMLRD